MPHHHVRQIKEGDKCPYFIHVDVIDWDPIGKNDVIGALMLPLNDFVQRRRIFRSPIGIGLCSYFHTFFAIGLSSSCFV